MNKEQEPVIAVICGGPSAEASVSRVSAAGVTKALQANYKNVHTLELDETLTTTLLALKADVVFPVLHGPPGEDGTVQGFLEILAIPYVGSGVHASACAMDKIVSKQIFRQSGLPLIDDLILDKSNPIESSVERIIDKLGTYVVVKPSRQGSALGVAILENGNQLHSALEEAFRLDDQVLVEKRIDGKDITCGVLERAGVAETCPVIEIVTPEDSWYDFEHRYTEGLSQHVMPAPLSEATTQII